MRIVRSMMATCLFLGLATGVGMAGAGSGSAAGSAKAAGSGSASAAPAMAMPTAPPELIDMGKKMAGTWHCTGTVTMPDKSTKPTKGDLKFSVELDKMWIKASMTETGTKTPYKFEAYVSYDAASKKWTHISLDNMGGYELSHSDGMSGNAVTWMGESTMMGMTMKTKSVHTMVSDKDVKIDDTMSMDGKTWTPMVSVECKK